MQFSDTSGKNGLIQTWERWTRTPDGGCTGTLLKQVTGDINNEFDDLMPQLLLFNDQIRWDDANHTDAPVGYFNIVSGQNDYKFTDDDNSLDILNVTKVRILTNATGTQYYELERMTLDDPDVAEVMSPSSGQTGVPRRFLEVGNILYLDIKPNYAATNGIEMFFGREQSYFASTDTTKEPGIPKPFHHLLALKPALNWNRINRADDLSLIRELKEEIAKKEENLRTFINQKHPSKTRLRMAYPPNFS